MESDICGASMRIGIYFADYRPEAGGGYTYVTDLLEAFAENAASSEHQYVLLCDPAAVESIRIKVYAANVTVVPVPKPTLWLSGLKYFSPLFRWMWRRPSRLEKIARLNAVQVLWFVGISAYECPDIPYIATLWDLQHRQQPFFPEVSNAGTWDKREQFYGYFLRRATYCITGTETGKNEIKYLYQLGHERVRVIPLPTPKFALHATPSAIDVRNRFNIEKQYVFYPAQFWPHKNHANLILALKCLKERHGVELILALSGADKGNFSFIKEFARQQGMQEQVRFLGFVSQDELVALYRQAVALTFVTYFGPDNIPPLEAFALGCPVIASAVEGSREQFKDAVVYVDQSNPIDIAQAIWNIYSNQELRETLVKAGFKRARQWTSADYTREIFALFDEFSAVRLNWA